MAWPIVIATNGIGIPVTEVPDGPRGGVPYEIATNGFGTPVVFVASGGAPVTRYTGGNPFAQTEDILGAGGLDYALFNYGQNQFQDLAGTIPATMGQSVALWNVREKSPHFANQSVAAQRPVLQPEGLKGDGSDDNLLTDWFAQAGANCIIAQVTVPASLGAQDQFILGADEGTGPKFRIGLQASTGRVVVSLGGTVAYIFGSDLRGQAAIIGIGCDGANVTCFANGDTGGFVQSGQPTLTVPSRLGCRNSSGTPASFFGGSIKRSAFGKTALTLEQFQTIRAEWLAAA